MMMGGLVGAHIIPASFNNMPRHSGSEVKLPSFSKKEMCVFLKI